MKKVIVWVCAILCVVVASIVPCWADTWEDENPNYGLALAGAPVYANGLNNTQKVIEIVDKATELGLFGGAYPVAIYYQFNASNDAFKIIVAVPASGTEGNYNVSTTQAPIKRGAYVMQTLNVNFQFMVASTSTYLSTPWALYTLQYNGDWSLTRYMSAGATFMTSNTTIGAQTDVIYKRVAIWTEATNGWVKPPTTQTEADIIGWGVNTTTVAGLQAVIDKYDKQIEMLTSEPIVVPPASYELDIASIFDGMFNGIHNIFGGFDIELFGISIVGVLVACLVIAIVTFIVKRLWK